MNKPFRVLVILTAAASGNGCDNNAERRTVMFAEEAALRTARDGLGTSPQTYVVDDGREFTTKPREQMIINALAGTETVSDFHLITGMTMARYVPLDSVCKDRRIVKFEGLPDWKSAVFQCDLKSLMTDERVKEIKLNIRARSVDPNANKPMIDAERLTTFGALRN